MRSRLLTGAGVLLLRVACRCSRRRPRSRNRRRRWRPGRRCRRWGRLISGSVAPIPTSMLRVTSAIATFATGAASLFEFSKETESYFTTASAFNVGYRDQQYKVDYQRSKVDFRFLWDSIPTNFSELTVSPWTVSDDGVLTHQIRRRDSRCRIGRRSACRARRARRRRPAATRRRQPPLSTTAPSTIEALSEFDIRSRRDTAAFGLKYAANQNLDVNLKFATTGRKRPSALGRLVCLQQRQRSAAAARQSHQRHLRRYRVGPSKGMVRLRLGRIVLQQRCSIRLVWDNPIRATDFNNGLLPPERAVRSQRLQQWQRAGAGTHGALARQLHERA